MGDQGDGFHMSERGRPGVPLVTISSPMSFIKPYFDTALLDRNSPGSLLFWACKRKPVVLAHRVLPSTMLCLFCFEQCLAPDHPGDRYQGYQMCGRDLREQKWLVRRELGEHGLIGGGLPVTYG